MEVNDRVRLYDKDLVHPNMKGTIKELKSDIAKIKLDDGCSLWCGLNEIVTIEKE